MENKIIDVTHASFSYEKGREVIKDISFSIYRGEAVGLIGANGSGKSTLLKMLTGLVSHEGSIKVDGLEVEKKNLSAIRRKLGLVMQDSESQLFMPTLYDDIAFAPRNYGYDEKQVEAAVNETLERTGILHLKNRQNYKMSGGEKRMGCIATVLAMKPELILMDEPSIALDPSNRRALINNLNAISESKLISSHDLDMILETCDRVILLNDTGILADGDALEILNNREMLERSHLELPLCLQKCVPYSKIDNKNNL